VLIVVEYGRRFLKCLSINLTYPHAGIGLKDSDRIVKILSMSAGILMTTLSSSDSLILAQRLSIGNQVYLPKRFLAGILPTSLVDRYSFWQSKNDDIIGYEEFESTDDDEEELIINEE